jgi:hypothetical protein
LLAVRKTDNQKGVVVLAKDLSIVSDLDASGVGDFALKHGIPVYAIMYKAGYQGKFGAKVTCERSYGEYWMSPDTKNDPSQGADALMGFMNDFLNKAAGWEYDFSYTTVTPKDGAQHVVQIKTPFGPEGFTYEAPAKTLVEKLKDNLLFVIIGGILFIGIIVLLVILSRKRKKERILKDAEFKQTQQKLDEQKASADRAKMETDAKLRTIEDKEQARIRDFEEQQRKEREAIENKRLINEMLERGAFANLVYASGTESGRFELSEPVIKIGRNPTNHFHINHVSVSREHATVQFINGGYYLKDLGSSNGTFVNGRRITQEKLSDGDHIAFGEIAVTFHI